MEDELRNLRKWDRSQRGDRVLVHEVPVLSTKIPERKNKREKFIKKNTTKENFPE